jgi:hypothetical protein
MNDVDVGNTSDALTCFEAVQQLVTLGRHRFAKIFPGQSFDASVWDISSLLERSHWRDRANLHFTRYRTTDEPLPDSFALVIKSWVILESRTVTNMKHRVAACRFLWEVLHLRYAPRPDLFQ